MADIIFATYIGNGAFVNGVPARDLTKAEWEALSADERAAAAPLFKLNAVTAKRESSKAEESSK